MELVKEGKLYTEEYWQFFLRGLLVKKLSYEYAPYWKVVKGLGTTWWVGADVAGDFEAGMPLDYPSSHIE